MTALSPDGLTAVSYTHLDVYKRQVETMVGFAVEEKFDYVVVAQDDPLALGMVDELAKSCV